MLWAALASSSDAQLAAIAGKALKEARYHQQHAADWVVRLGDGTDESARRLRAALDALWPYTAELFDDDAVDAQAAATGLGPACERAARGLAGRDGPGVRRGGPRRAGRHALPQPRQARRHSEHMGFLLAEMQSLPRAFPGGGW